MSLSLNFTIYKKLSKVFFPFPFFWIVTHLEADAVARHVKLSALQNINGKTFPFNVLITVF